MTELNKPLEGSVCPEFLSIAFDKLIYKTPQKVIDYIRMNVMIGNPPFKTSKDEI